MYSSIVKPVSSFRIGSNNTGAFVLLYSYLDYCCMVLNSSARYALQLLELGTAAQQEQKAQNNKPSAIKDTAQQQSVSS